MVSYHELTWSRDDVSSCNYHEKPYRHVHCRCIGCQGKATSRSTELRHWSETRLCTAASARSRTSGNEDGTDHTETPSPMLMDIDGDESSLPVPPDYDQDDLEHQPSTFDNEVEVGGGDPNLLGDSTQRLGNNAESQSEENPLKKIVLKAVLEALSIMDSSGSSIKTFEDILDYGKRLLFTSVGSDIDVDVLMALWPRNWNGVQSFLKEEGFSDPKEYYICICRSTEEVRRNGKTTMKYKYSRKWSIMHSKEDVCHHCGSHGYIKYYYLGLNAKVKNWFKTKSMCKKMLSHWVEKEHWLGQVSSWPTKKEFWDGQRWVDLQWFWDPNQTWLLPIRCVGCQGIISVQTMSDCQKNDDGVLLVDCPECFHTFPFEIKTAHGSPLNLALLGHFDGWQPFSTSYRSCASIEVSIANMSKEDRSHVDEVYVVGFLPSTSVPNDLPEGLDPFLQPLMDDLCEGFIDGFQVKYPPGIEINDYETGEFETVRVLLLCWSGDHPG